MLTDTSPVAPALQLRPRALKRAGNPPMTPGATGLMRGHRSAGVKEGLVRVGKQPELPPVGNGDTVKGPV